MCCRDNVRLNGWPWSTHGSCYERLSLTFHSFRELSIHLIQCIWSSLIFTAMHIAVVIDGRKSFFPEICVILMNRWRDFINATANNDNNGRTSFGVPVELKGSKRTRRTGEVLRGKVRWTGTSQRLGLKKIRKMPLEWTTTKKCFFFVRAHEVVQQRSGAKRTDQQIKKN